MQQSGLAYFSGWLTEAQSSVWPTDSWVYMCSSFSSSVKIAVSNNWEVTTTRKDAAVNGVTFDTLGVNIYNGGEHSDFGIAEVIIWNRALSRSELFSMQRYLATKYGFAGDVSTNEFMCASL